MLPLAYWLQRTFHLPAARWLTPRTHEHWLYSGLLQQTNVAAAVPVSTGTLRMRMWADCSSHCLPARDITSCCLFLHAVCAPALLLKNVYLILSLDHFLVCRVRAPLRLAVRSACSRDALRAACLPPGTHCLHARSAATSARATRSNRGTVSGRCLRFTLGLAHARCRRRSDAIGTFRAVRAWHEQLSSLALLFQHCVSFTRVWSYSPPYSNTYYSLQRRLCRTLVLRSFTACADSFSVVKNQAG